LVPLVTVVTLVPLVTVVTLVPLVTVVTEFIHVDGQIRPALCPLFSWTWCKDRTLTGKQFNNPVSVAVYYRKDLTKAGIQFITSRSCCTVLLEIHLVQGTDPIMFSNSVVLSPGTLEHNLPCS
jgi:hypothetical protein